MMSKSVLFDLDHNRKRLEYYHQLKEKSAGTGKTTVIDKWIEIYSNRVSKLERQVQKLGLKTQLHRDEPETKRA